MVVSKQYKTAKAITIRFISFALIDKLLFLKKTSHKSSKLVPRLNLCQVKSSLDTINLTRYDLIVDNAWDTTSILYECRKCKTNKLLSCFASNCQTCLNCSSHRTSNRTKASKRKAAKLLRMPKWLTQFQKAQINNFYKKALLLTKNTGIPYEVDHIVPLRGKYVSGLHVPWNLQVILKSENRLKANKYA